MIGLAKMNKVADFDQLHNMKINPKIYIKSTNKDSVTFTLKID
jgi:hypothetical protein